MLWVVFLYALKTVKECKNEWVLNVLSILFLSMFVDSVKVWKSECYSVTNPLHYATFKEYQKETRSNRITGFTDYIVRLNSVFSLIGP